MPAEDGGLGRVLCATCHASACSSVTARQRCHCGPSPNPLCQPHFSACQLCTTPRDGPLCTALFSPASPWGEEPKWLWGGQPVIVHVHLPGCKVVPSLRYKKCPSTWRNRSNRNNARIKAHGYERLREPRFYKLAA